MKNHKIQPERLYPVSIPVDPEPVYPFVSLPYEIISDMEAYKPGDVVCVEVYMKITDINKSSFSGDLLKSEVETMDEEVKEKD